MSYEEQISYNYEFHLEDGAAVLGNFLCLRSFYNKEQFIRKSTQIFTSCNVL